MPDREPFELTSFAKIDRFRGLLSQADGVVYGFRGRDFVRFAPPFRTAELIASLPRRGSRRAPAGRLLERLLRLEVYRLVRTPTGTDIATSREGILRRAVDSPRFDVVFSDPRSRRPISLCCDGDGRLYFGQYFSNESREPVSIFGSEDDGKTWHECYRFPAGAVRHVHGLVFDRFRNKIWVLTGDYGDEAKIALAAPGFRELDVVLQGSQQTRACDGVCTSSGFIFATDTPLEQNHVVLLDPTTRQSQQLAPVQNSVLFMGQACGGVFLSTIVEPSQVNTTRSVHIWFSPDDRHWKEIWSGPRDGWSLKYFQYPMGSFALGPRQCPFAFVNLRGVRGHDGTCLVMQRVES